MKKILIGEITSSKAIVIAKYLRKNYESIKIFTYDNRKFTKFIRTKYSDDHFILRNNTVNSYLDSLSKLVRDLDIDFFIPVHSTYIGTILKNRVKFGDSLSYIGDFSCYKKLHIKDTLQHIAVSLGVDTPHNFTDFKSAQVPFVAKPVSGSSSKGVIYFKDETPDISQLKENRKYVFQQYIEGFGCGYSVYAKDGKILRGYGHRRLAEFPIKGGSSVYRAGFFVEQMKTVAKKILQETGWTGFAMFEFKYTKDERLVLIEVNPRVWGSVNQGLQNGVNYFEPFLNESDNAERKVENINTYLSPQIYIVLLLYILNMNFSPVYSFFKTSNKRKPDVDLFNDFTGWLSGIVRALSK